MNNKELYELTEAEFSLLVYGVIDYFDASIAAKTEEVYRLREELNYENRDIIRAYIYKAQEEINDLIMQRVAFLDKIGYNDTELMGLYSVLPEEDEVYGTFYDKQGLKDFLNKYYPNALTNRYQLDFTNLNAMEQLELIAKKQNYYLSNKEYDLERTALFILQEARSGYYGRFTLDRCGDETNN